MPRSALTRAVLLACAGAAVAGGLPEAQAQIAGDARLYEARRAPAAPVIDGDLDEDVWRAAPWTESFVDIRGESWPTPQWTTRARLTWDSCCLYVGAELEEPHLWATLTDRDAIIYRDHDFEVFLDPDGDGLAYYELEINAFGTEFDLFLDKPYRNEGRAHIDWDIAGLRTAVRLDGTLNDPSDEDRGWTVEIAIPWAALRPPDGVASGPEAVRAYLRSLVGELAANPAIDGVHLDYVRHCDVILPRGLSETYDLVQDVEHPEFDFCYCGVCRELFAAVDGRDPLEVPDPPADEAWRRFRLDSVTGAVRELADAVHRYGKPITAAVFPTPTIARTLVRQAWDEWPLDRFFPMLYQGFYLEDIAWIGDGVREGVAAMDGRDGTPLCAGLYIPSLDPRQLAEAVGTARRAGAAGVSLFEMDGLGDEHLAALRAALV